MQQLSNVASLAGKKVVDAKYPSDNKLVLFLDDESYIVLWARLGYDWADLEVYTDDLDVDGKLKIGLITRQEYDEIVNAKHREYLTRIENKERAEYERLKKKYGKE
jgi:hypothetical protein